MLEVALMMIMPMMKTAQVLSLFLSSLADGQIEQGNRRNVC